MNDKCVWVFSFCFFYLLTSIVLNIWIWNSGNRQNDDNNTTICGVVFLKLFSHSTLKTILTNQILIGNVFFQQTPEKRKIRWRKLKYVNKNDIKIETAPSVEWINVHWTKFTHQKQCVMLLSSNFQNILKKKITDVILIDRTLVRPFIQLVFTIWKLKIWFMALLPTDSIGI